jgi:DNA-binding NarL/FixJ family response regulator
MGESKGQVRNADKVAIVDDNSIIRSGLSAFIRSTEGLLLVGEAVDGEGIQRVIWCDQTWC